MTAALAAFLLLAGMGAGQTVPTAYAQEIQTAEETGEVRSAESETSEETATYGNTPYAPYEMLTQNQRNTYTRIQQFNQRRQQWMQSRLPYTEPRDLEAEAAAVKEAAAKQVEQAKSRVTNERARYEEEQRNTWHHPLVIDTYVTSPFGWRWHPVYGYYRMHNGVDLEGDWGDLVRASRGGVVCEAGWNQYYGYYVVIDHGDGYKTEYLHLWTYYVEVGQEVKYCEIIGEVGSTGVSTGAHLHFGMLYEDEYIDPADYIEF